MPRDPRFDPLFEPIQIGPKTLKNRFYQVPQCTGAGVERPGANAAHRSVKAEGGWAALNTEACCIHPEVDQTVSTVTTIWDQGDVINHRHMVDSVHAWGALAGIELTYVGGLLDNLGHRAVAAATHQFPSPWIPQVYSYEADAEDFQRIHRMYLEAAKRALDAGFDIIYVHGTHGAFPVQVLSKHFNRRTDAYGGSFENRARFWVELLEGLKAAAGDSCAIATRFSVDQISGPYGIEVGDEGLRFIEYATRLGLVDLWDVNISGLHNWGEDAASSRFHGANHQLPWTREVKRIAKVPVVGVGRFTSPDDMVNVVASGQYDIIGCARPSIADPWLPRKIDEGRIEDICECIGCNMCISRFEGGGVIVCTQNPTALEEYRRGWHPERFDVADDPCSVMVVGGGPAGMECARVLGLRGYTVHLVEAEPELGGHLRHVARLPGLAEWARVIDYRKTQFAKLDNLAVHRGTGAATADDILEFEAERVVLAAGARWVGDGASAMGPDAIPGVDSELPGFVTPEQFWAGKEVGERIVVLDGDGYFMAIGIAEALADGGASVTILTHFETVAPLTEYTQESDNLRRMMREKGIAQRTAHWLEGVAAGAGGLQVTAYDLYRDGPTRVREPVTGASPYPPGADVETLECDTVVLCTARRSNDELWRELRERAEEWAAHGIKSVTRAGDCLAPRYLADAIFDGHRVARELDSADPQRPRAVIRERQIWGNPTYPELGDRVI